MIRLLRLGIALVLCVAMVRAGATDVTAHWPPLPVLPTPATLTKLDEETLQRLTIFASPWGVVPAIMPVESLDSGLQTVPGGSLALTLGVFECCYFFEPVPVRAAWSVSPAEGVDIDPSTGFLTVDPATPSGSVFTVRADVENGRRIVTGDLHVFSPEANPLVGTWVEAEEIDCATGATVVPAQPIEELVFAADGTFTVTWLPFEVYKDYWGTYVFDLAAGTLDLTITYGNDVPTDFDGEGTFALTAEGRLVLTDLWLGTPQLGTGAPNCGHVFA